MDPRLKHPFTCLVAGPTSCGKTTFVTELVTKAQQLITPPPDKIVWCYGEWQPAYDQLSRGGTIEFVDGLPDPNSFDAKTRTLTIIDDLMAETDERVTQLFTKKSHHCNASVVYVVQNLFPKGKENRTISLNAHYMVIFKNPRDATQITHLAKQMYPGHVKFVQEAFQDATSEPFSYLFVDLKQNTPEHLRLRSQVLSMEMQYVYLRKK